MISSIQAHRPLDGLTTFGTRSEADHYAEAGSLDELEAHLAEANANGLPVHFLGAGANTIAMSRVPGMTIRITIKGVEMSAAPNGDVLVKCGAGEVFDDIVARTLKAGIGGLENLSAIPGTVGGAVVQNIGAYGVELAERLSSITVYDRAEKVVRVLTVEECDFSYRHSIMKTEAGRNFVVLSVTLRLPAVWTPVLGYKDLEAEIEARGLTAETVTAPVMSEIVRAVRARRDRERRLLLHEPDRHEGSLARAPHQASEPRLLQARRRSHEARRRLAHRGRRLQGLGRRSCWRLRAPCAHYRQPRRRHGRGRHGAR